MSEAQGRLVRIAASGACVVAVTVAALFALASAAVAKPQPGDLDRSFGGDGVALTQISPGSSYADAVAIGRKHRIVVAGYKNRSKTIAVARYKPNGHLDPSFSRNGKLATAFGQGRMFPNAVAVGRNGSVVVAGRACSPCAFGAIKYQPDGKLDKSFGNGGRVKVAFPGNQDSSAIAVAITSGGRVVLGGTTCPPLVARDCKFALARLDRSGTLDPTFGNGGRVITQFTDKSGQPIFSAAGGMAIDSHGRIVLGGGSSARLMLACYGPNGRLVRSFGNDGKVVDSHIDAATAVVSDAKDRIVVAGPGYSLARFDSEGSLDPSFGKGGEASTNRVKGHLLSMAMDSRNRIVVAGGPYWTVVRFRPNGKLSRPFGHRGIVRYRAGKHGPYSPNGLAIDSHDRPVVAGIGRRRGSARRVFAVARFLG
jgi:uncharacterized delta-60 repeat protein